MSRHPRAGASLLSYLQWDILLFILNKVPASFKVAGAERLVPSVRPCLASAVSRAEHG
jgi:hypothetical protein